jgi:hypothetical protein
VAWIIHQFRPLVSSAGVLPASARSSVGKLHGDPPAGHGKVITREHRWRFQRLSAVKIRVAANETILTPNELHPSAITSHAPLAPAITHRPACRSALAGSP